MKVKVIGLIGPADSGKTQTLKMVDTSVTNKNRKAFYYKKHIIKRKRIIKKNPRETIGTPYYTRTKEYATVHSGIH